MTVLTEELFERLRARILSGELPAGSRLPPERDLATAFGTNRNTLREAIRRLEQARLVTVRQGQGVTVADFRREGTIELLGPFLAHGGDPAEKARVVLDLLEPRAKVIDFLVESAARAARAEDHDALDRTAAVVRAAEASRDALAYVEAQHDYLDALVTATRSLPTRWIANPLLRATRDMLRRNPRWILFEPSFAAMADAVTQAVAAGDAAAGRAACARFHDHADALLRPVLAVAAEAL